jgi:hypothetical protein
VAAPRRPSGGRERVDGGDDLVDRGAHPIGVGADVPGNTVPEHCSFGGEGTPYERHLLPTIGVIAAPQSLYDPAFGLEGIDFDVMGNELRGFTELVNRLGTMDQSAIAGDVPTERAQRAAGAPACPPAN